MKKITNAISSNGRLSLVTGRVPLSSALTALFIFPINSKQLSRDAYVLGAEPVRAMAGAADGSAGVVFDVYSYYHSLYVQSIISVNTNYSVRKLPQMSVQQNCGFTTIV